MDDIVPEIDPREMARARNIAHEELGRITGHEVHDGYIDRHGNSWRVARVPQMRADLTAEARRFMVNPEPWAIRTPDWLTLYQQKPISERETVSNDRHSPNRQRRPAGVPQGHNASRFGHSRRHHG